MATVTADRYID